MKKLILLSLIVSGFFALPAVGADLQMVKKSKLQVCTNYEAFFEAARLGDVKQVEEMIQAGAEVDHDQGGLTALMSAAWAGRVEVVDLLLKFGAAIDRKDSCGYTALMRAGMQGRVEVVDFLLRSGAAIDHRGVSGLTALMLASLEGCVEVVDLLLKFGAAIDRENEFGRTALMWAAMRGHVAVMKALLLAGANPHIKNEKNKNQTALDMAKECGKETEFRKAVRLAQLTRQAMRLLWKGFEDEENSPLSKLPAELIAQIIGYL